MKNNIIKILVLIVLFGFQACTKDFLELEPKTGQMEENYYKTESDALLSLTSVYDALSVQNWNFVPIVSDIVSDDGFTGGSDAGDMRQWQEFEQFIATPENDAAKALWDRCYTGIYRANLYLEKQDLIEWETEGLKEKYAAEAKFLRAYFYWDLVRHYGSVPVILEVLPSVEDYKNVKQESPDVVFTQIASDLLSSIESLSTTLTSAEKGRATKYAAEALLARIYLFYEGFAKNTFGLSGAWTDGETTIDKAYAQAAIDDIVDNGGYVLLDNYADVFAWDNENNAESLFEFQYSEKSKADDWDSGWGTNGNFSILFYGPRNAKGDSPYADLESWSFCVASWSLVDEFEADDPRKEITIFDAENELDSYTAAFMNTGYFFRKNMGLLEYKAQAGDYKHNWRKNYIDIRFADVLLMGAELYVDDNPTKAVDYLNRVRTRSMGDAAALSSITIDDIYHERRVELAGEGHRKWDLMRRGLTYAGTKINESFNVPEGISNAQDFTGRTFVENTWLMFPIPASEIRNTNSGTLSQYVPAYK